MFQTLGSNLNPTLTQLAKTRRALFVEGKDFQILSLFAERLGLTQIANRATFAVVPSQGFNPQKVVDVSAGIVATLGTRILVGAIFDRDYRSDGELAAIEAELRTKVDLVRIHRRKELENFLLCPTVLERCIGSRLADRRSRTGSAKPFTHHASDVLAALSEKFRVPVQAQHVTHFCDHEASVRRGVHDATLAGEAIADFEMRWADFDTRMTLVPGKAMLTALNEFLTSEYQISLTPGAIVRAFRRDEVPVEMSDLLASVDAFSRTQLS